MSLPKLNRRLTLAAARGDFATDGALALVRVMKATRSRWEHRDPELAAALDEGDRRWPDDPGRQPGPRDHRADWEPAPPETKPEREEGPPEVAGAARPRPGHLLMAEAAAQDPRFRAAFLEGLGLYFARRRGQPDWRDWAAMAALAEFILRVGVTKPREVLPGWRKTGVVSARSRTGKREREANVSAGMTVGGLVVAEVERRHCTNAQAVALISRDRDLVRGTTVGGVLHAFCCRSYVCPGHCALVAARLAEFLPPVLGPALWRGRAEDETAAARFRRAVTKATRCADRVPMWTKVVSTSLRTETTASGDHVGYPPRGSLHRGISDAPQRVTGSSRVRGGSSARLRAGGYALLTNVALPELEGVHLERCRRQVQRQEAYDDLVRSVAEGAVGGLSWPEWNRRYETLRGNLPIFEGLTAHTERSDAVHDEAGMPIDWSSARGRWQTVSVKSERPTFPCAPGTTPETSQELLRELFRREGTASGHSMEPR